MSTNMDIPAATARVLQDIVLERQYQLDRFGRQDRLGPSDWLLLLTKHVGKAAAETYPTIFKAEPTFPVLRGHLVRIATIAVAAIESIDGR